MHLSAAMKIDGGLWFGAALPHMLIRGMRGKILVQAGLNLSGGPLGIAIESSNDGGYIFPFRRLVMRVVMRPYDRARPGFAQFQIQRQARYARRLIDFLEVVQIPVKNIIAVRIAPKNVHIPVAS
jgi:hypothetical protein